MYSWKAFTLSPASAAAANELCKFLGVAAEFPLVAVAVAGGVFSTAPVTSTKIFLELLLGDLKPLWARRKSAFWGGT